MQKDEKNLLENEIKRLKIKCNTVIDHMEKMSEFYNKDNGKLLALFIEFLNAVHSENNYYFIEKKTKNSDQFAYILVADFKSFFSSRYPQITGYKGHNQLFQYFRMLRFIPEDEDETFTNHKGKKRLKVYKSVFEFLTQKED